MAPKLYNLIKLIIYNINNRKNIFTIKYTFFFYSILLIFEKEFGFISYNFIVGGWIFVILNLTHFYLKSKKLQYKIFNGKLRNNLMSYKQLKSFKAFSNYIIIFTTKGVCSIDKVINQKKGGVLYCLVY